MGNPKQKWTSEEEEALRAGVRKHGTGKWKLIQRDPEFSHLLYSRSNIDLKDKWRNLTVSATNGVIPRGKTQLKAKTSMDVPAAPVPITDAPAATVPITQAPAAPVSFTQAPIASVPLTQPPASSTPVSNDVSMDPVTEDSTKYLLDRKTASKYNAMIYEALSALNEPNGSDITTLVNFIEQRHEVPQHFRRVITSRLRRLVAQEKLEKVQNSYRIRKEFLQGSKPPIPKPNDTLTQPQLEPYAQPQQQPLPLSQPQPQPLHQQQSQQQLQLQPQPQPLSQPLQISGDTVEEITIGAAHAISEAENTSFVLAEAVKEAERVERLSEDTDVMLLMAHEIINKTLRGETVLVA